MKYCTKCGTPIPDDSVYCDQCGAKVGKDDTEDKEKREEKELEETIETTAHEETSTDEDQIDQTQEDVSNVDSIASAQGEFEKQKSEKELSSVDLVAFEQDEEEKQKSKIGKIFIAICLAAIILICIIATNATRKDLANVYSHGNTVISLAKDKTYRITRGDSIELGTYFVDDDHIYFIQANNSVSRQEYKKTNNSLILFDSLINGVNAGNAYDADNHIPVSNSESIKEATELVPDAYYSEGKRLCYIFFDNGKFSTTDAYKNIISRGRYTVSENKVTLLYYQNDDPKEMVFENQINGINLFEINDNGEYENGYYYFRCTEQIDEEKFIQEKNWEPQNNSNY